MAQEHLPPLASEPVRAARCPEQLDQSPEAAAAAPGVRRRWRASLAQQAERSPAHLLLDGSAVAQPGATAPGRG